MRPLRGPTKQFYAQPPIESNHWPINPGIRGLLLKPEDAPAEGEEVATVDEGRGPVVLYRIW